MSNGIDPKFDWVTARHTCSAANMYEQLREIAKANVETRNAQLPRPRFLCNDVSGRAVFVVVDTSAHSGRRGVQVESRDTTLHVTFAERAGYENGKDLVIGIRLSSLGDCVYVIDDEELLPWEVVMQLLDWLFFDGR
jgi:hypothetical protein